MSSAWTVSITGDSMIVVVQRILSSSVVADGLPAGKAGEGMLLLVGVREGDTKADADILAKKIANLRIFTDENDRINLSIQQIGGQVLAVSNFTLCADCTSGNRPSFFGAMEPSSANELYEYFCHKLVENGVSHVETGVFGADMKIEAKLDGPITIVLDSALWRKPCSQ